MLTGVDPSLDGAVVLLEHVIQIRYWPMPAILGQTAFGFELRDGRRIRQWGACWLACHLYEQLGLDEFWAERLADSREGTCWQHILQTLVCYRLIDPGSEWRLHRQWYEQSAMGDLLDEDYSLVEKNALYRCLDKVLKHKEQLFSHLRQRWQDLFGVRFEVLLYDLTSTYFESDPAFEETDKRQFGYSRDKRPTVCKWSSGSSSVLKASHSPMRCCRATPRTKPRCASSWARSKSNTARPRGSG